MKLSELKNRFLSTQRGRQFALCGTIIGAALLTSASIFATGPSATPNAHAEKAWPVSVAIAQPDAIRPNFAAFGRLEANRTAHLRSDLVARIDQVHVQEGDQVVVDQLLVKLDDRETRLQILERQADLKQQQANLASLKLQLQLEQENDAHFASRHQLSQAKLRRHQDLMNKRLISRALFDEVVSQADQASIEYRNHVRVLTNLPNQVAAGEAQVAKAQALLEQAHIDLEKTEIRAPFAGPVLAVHVAPGDHSSMAAPLLDMAQASSFEVRVQIPDTYVRRFHNAATNTITATAENGAQLTLNRIAGLVRTGQTGTDAFFTFTQHNGPMPPLGRIFDVSIELPTEQNLIAVPVQSIYENNRVYVVKDNRLVGHEIQRIGELEADAGGLQVLVRSKAIQAGDQLITTQLPRAINGLLVEVANQT